MKYKTLALLCASLLLGLTSHAATLTVRVVNISSSDGVVACGLFLSADGFPMEAASGMEQRVVASEGEMLFVFENVTPGMVAVSVSHDANDNGETDTNFLGIPREDWGVSNNVRPNLRAPRFSEAQFEITGNTTIEIRVD